MNLNFLRNKKWNLQNDNGPPIVGMERTEDKDISKGLFTLPKNTTSSQSSHKSKIGQSIYWRNPFSTTGIPSNIDWQSPFGRNREGGFGVYEH